MLKIITAARAFDLCRESANAFAGKSLSGNRETDKLTLGKRPREGSADLG